MLSIGPLTRKAVLPSRFAVKAWLHQSQSIPLISGLPGDGGVGPVGSPQEMIDPMLIATLWSGLSMVAHPNPPGLSLEDHPGGAVNAQFPALTVDGSRCAGTRATAARNFQATFRTLFIRDSPPSSILTPQLRFRFTDPPHLCPTVRPASATWPDTGQVNDSDQFSAIVPLPASEILAQVLEGLEYLGYEEDLSAEHSGQYVLGDPDEPDAKASVTDAGGTTLIRVTRYASPAIPEYDTPRESLSEERVTVVAVKPEPEGCALNVSGWVSETVTELLGCLDHELLLQQSASITCGVGYRTVLDGFIKDLRESGFRYERATPGGGLHLQASNPLDPDAEPWTATVVRYPDCAIATVTRPDQGVAEVDQYMFSEIRGRTMMRVRSDAAIMSLDLMDNLITKIVEAELSQIV